MGPERGLRGNAALGELDLSRVVQGLPASRVNATADVDLVVDAGNDIDGRAALHVAPTVVDGYRVDAARGEGDDRRLAGAARRRRARLRGPRHREGRDRARRSTAAAPRASWPAGSPASTCAGCRAVWACRRLATRAGGRYRARLDDRGPSGELVFDASTVEGASIDAGTRVSGTLYGSRPTFTATGGIRGVDPHRFGRVLRLPALTEARLRGRIDATFDVAGSGKTLQTLELQGRLGVPHATIVGGEVRDAVADVRLTRGALEGTLTAAFTNIDPGLAADRPPLAGAVSGSIDAAMATPSITTFSLPDTTGRVALTLEPSRVGDQTDRSRGAAGHARRRRPRRRVARRRRPARRRDGEGAGRAHARRGVHAAVPHHVRRPGARGGARRPDAMSPAPAPSRARSPATSPSCTPPARWPWRTPPTARRPAPSTPRCATTSRCPISTRSGSASTRRPAPRWSKRRGSRCARSPRTSATPIAPRRSRRPSPPATRGRSRPRAAVALPQPAGVDVRLDRLTATAEGTSWSLTEPARIVYAGDRVDVDRLALASGPQKIEAAGAVAHRRRDGARRARGSAAAAHADRRRPGGGRPPREDGPRSGRHR